MPSPDDPRSRRALALLSHGKPRPYRRQVHSDEPPRLSRPQIGLLIAGAIVLAALILAVAVVVQEHENAVRGKQIIAAGTAPEPVPDPPDPVQAAEVVAPLPLTPPALDDSSLPLHDPRTPPRLAARPAARHLPARRHAAVPAPRHVARPAPAANAAAADPDVDLIATILALTPEPVSSRRADVCTASTATRPACVKTQGMRP